MAITADAFMGIIIALMFFSLGVATTVVANRGVPSSRQTRDSTGEPVVVTGVTRDYPNIIFGSMFIIIGVVLFTMAARAIMS